MVIHKIEDKKTACGRDIWKEEIEASADWKDVDCKQCKRKMREGRGKRSLQKDNNFMPNDIPRTRGASAR
jgi:hypothetical protein